MVRSYSYSLNIRGRFGLNDQEIEGERGFLLRGRNYELVYTDMFVDQAHP